MNDDKIWKERAMPALNEMYSKAEPIIDELRGLNWDQVLKACPKQRGTNKTQLMYYAFYLDIEEYEKIFEKYSKNFRHYWRWPHRSEIIYDDDDIKRMKQRLAELDESSFDYKILKEKIDRNDVNKERDNKWRKYLKERDALEEQAKENETKLGKKEANRLKNKMLTSLCKSYNMQWRSNDKEKLYFTLTDLSPVPIRDMFEAYKESYQLMVDKLGDNCTDYVELENAAAEVMDKVNDSHHHQCRWPMILDLYVFCRNIKHGSQLD